PVEDLRRVDDDELSRRNKLGKEQEAVAYKKIKQSFRSLLQKHNKLRTGGEESPIPLFHLPIKVLHVDGDETYLDKCNDLYKRLGLHVQSIYLQEKDMAEQIGGLIETYRPQIVVITGHDAYTEKEKNISDLNAYRHSKYFVEAVKKAREIV